MKVALVSTFKLITYYSVVDLALVVVLVVLTASFFLTSCSFSWLPFLQTAIFLPSSLCCFPDQLAHCIFFTNLELLFISLNLIFTELSILSLVLVT
jgi:hypothetical protein